MSARSLSLCVFLLLGAIVPRPTTGEVLLAPGEPLAAFHLEQLLVPQLPPLGEGERYDFSWSAPRLPLPNPAAAPVRLEVRRFSLEGAPARILAEVTASLPSGESTQLQVVGGLRVLVAVPTLREPVPAGTILTDDMVELVWLVREALPAGVFRDPQQIAGMETARRLPAGRPLTARDLVEPRLVRRGETVTVIWRAPGLELTGLARALEDAALGQSVRLVNVDSNRPLRGVVIGRKQVAVGDWP